MGIATRMRGLGNVGVHKYALCKNKADFKKVNPDYLFDTPFGYEFPYLFSSLEDGRELFYNGNYPYTKTSIKHFTNPVCFPKATSLYSTFEDLRFAYPHELVIDAPIATSFNYFLQDTGSTLKKITFNCPNATTLYDAFKSTGISQFEGELPVVTQGYQIFAYNKFKTFNIDMPKLTQMDNGFRGNTRLERITSNFPSLTSAQNAFYDCSNLSVFRGDLSKLSNGTSLFYNCILDKDSVKFLSENLPTYTSGTHNITIGIQKSLETDEEVLVAIATIKSKGWTVTTQWNTGYNGLEVLSNELNEKMELGIELPEGYTRLYYLEDLGRQWIDTEYIPTVNTGLYVIGKQIVSAEGWPIGISNATDGRSQGLTAPFWSRTSAYTACFQYNGLIAFNNYGRGEAYEGWTNFLNDKISKVDARGTVYSKSLSAHTRTWNYPMHMFRINAYNSTNKKPFNGRIYRVKISEGTEIVRDYVPALDPNGKPCMYELMEGKPFYNQGEYEDFDYDFPPTNSN
jgi:hypothetical protein